MLMELPYSGTLVKIILEEILCQSSALERVVHSFLALFNATCDSRSTWGRQWHHKLIRNLNLMCSTWWTSRYAYTYSLDTSISLVGTFCMFTEGIFLQLGSSAQSILFIQLWRKWTLMVVCRREATLLRRNIHWHCIKTRLRESLSNPIQSNPIFPIMRPLSCFIDEKRLILPGCSLPLLFHQVAPLPVLWLAELVWMAPHFQLRLPLLDYLVSYGLHHCCT